MTDELPTGPQPEVTPAQDLEAPQASSNDSLLFDVASDTNDSEVHETVPTEPEEIADFIPPADEPLEAPKKKTNGRLIITAAVFVLAVAGFGAFLLYGKDILGTGSTQTSLPTTTPPPVVTRPNIPTTSTQPARPIAAAPAPPRVTMPTQPLAPTAPVVVAQPVVPLTPEQKLQASMLQLAVTTPVPAQQPAGAIPDPFAGGKPPPVVKHVAMEWATSGDLKAAVDKSPFAPFVSVYSDPGKDDHHAQLIGRGLEVNKVMNRIVPVVNIKPPPVITVAAMSPVFPTPATGPRRIIDTTIVPIEPPVGRHAGWIYNAGNGQVLAIFEDRYGVAHTVKVGDEVDGMRVTSISPNGMVMVNIRTNKESRLMLRGLDASQIRTPVMANPVGTPFGAPIGTPNGTGNGTGAGTPNGGPNVPPWVR